MRKSLVVAACFLAAAAAPAEVKVMDTKDVVRLVSGEEVTGTVLASGLKAVVIVVEREETVVERTIPREQVESSVNQVSHQKRIGGAVLNFVNQDRAKKYGGEYYHGKHYEKYYS